MYYFPGNYETPRTLKRTVPFRNRSATGTYIMHRIYSSNQRAFLASQQSRTLARCSIKTHLLHPGRVHFHFATMICPIITVCLLSLITFPRYLRISRNSRFLISDARIIQDRIIICITSYRCHVLYRIALGPLIISITL